jgi:NAD(P)-dependent dehydrogenase (short-subunit alcohol dehydrogenase family)
MELGLRDKVAFVTGAASGIGRATALGLAGEGAVLALSDRDGAGLDALATELRAAGATVLTFAVDVSDAAAVDDAVARAATQLGGIDVAVNNAGVSGVPADGVPVRLVDSDEALYDQVLDVNLRGVWLCMRAELRVMVPGGRGSIVNITSVAGINGAPRFTTYSASKHGVVGLTKSAALEYARGGIRVNAVAPGNTDTAMIADWTAAPGGQAAAQKVQSVQPLGRIGTAAEIAAAIVWLVSDAASFVTGHVLVADGGFSAR